MLKECKTINLWGEEMKMKRILVAVLALAVMIAYMPTAAFAKTETQVAPRFSTLVDKNLAQTGEEMLDSETLGNLEANIDLDNDACQQAETSKSVLKITNKDGNIVVEEDLVYKDGSFGLEGTVEGVDEIIDAISADYADAYNNYYDGIDDIDAIPMMEKYGYKVEIVMTDSDEEHEFEVTDLFGTLMNKEVFEDTMDLVIDLFVGFFEEELEEALGIEIEYIEIDGEKVPAVNGEKLTFAKFVELYEAFLRNPDNELTEEEIQEELEGLKEYENIIAQFDNGYKGMLILDATAKCNCPEMGYYTVNHEYYDKDGNLADFDWEDSVAVELGTEISVDKLNYVTTYGGVEYKVEGVYLMDGETFDVDYTKPVTSFKVEEYTDVYVKYVPVEKTTTDTTTDNDTTVDTNKETDNDVKDNNDVDTPETGDDTPIALYVVLMAAAVLVMRKVRA